MVHCDDHDFLYSCSITPLRNPVKNPLTDQFHPKEQKRLLPPLPNHPQMKTLVTLLLPLPSSRQIPILLKTTIRMQQVTWDIMKFSAKKIMGRALRKELVSYLNICIMIRGQSRWVWTSWTVWCVSKMISGIEKIKKFSNSFSIFWRGRKPSRDR